MADRPILFSGPMIKALIAGTKTQTRRIFKPQPTIHAAGDCTINGHRGNVDYLMREIAPKHWLRIGVGDRLWVRETLAEQEAASGIRFMGYAADGRHVEHTGSGWPFKRKSVPSIHMPRWASRLTLHVTEVRVQRLQEINRDDALAEGIVEGDDRFFRASADHLGQASPQAAYGDLWEAINGPGSWDANPWVAAYTFTVERCNIDQARST